MDSSVAKAVADKSEKWKQNFGVVVDVTDIFLLKNSATPPRCRHTSGLAKLRFSPFSSTLVFWRDFGFSPQKNSNSKIDSLGLVSYLYFRDYLSL
jgi:hypothetical protein